MQKFESGASSSELKPRYDLIPFASLKRLADRLTMGAEIHGDNNYQKGGGDFWTDRKNHLVEHLFKYIENDKTDDHLGAILCNAAMLAWKEGVDNSLDEKTEENMIK